MKHDKQKAFELRMSGKSYKKIETELGISRGTLAGWFKNENWSKDVKRINTEKTHSFEHISRMQQARKDKLERAYLKAEAEAADEYDLFRTQPLFWAGLMAYAGEGDKRSRHLVRITNSEFYIHRVFILFAMKYLGVSSENVKCCLIIYPDHHEGVCREIWSNLLGITRENFHKTQIIEGKSQIRRLQYGIGMTIISSTVLKKKVLKWLSLAQDEQFRDAGMV